MRKHQSLHLSTHKHCDLEIRHSAKVTFLENFSDIFAISHRKIKHLLDTLQEKDIDEILHDAKLNLKKCFY